MAKQNPIWRKEKLKTYEVVRAYDLNFAAVLRWHKKKYGARPARYVPCWTPKMVRQVVAALREPGQSTDEVIALLKIDKPLLQYWIRTKKFRPIPQRRSRAGGTFRHRRWMPKHVESLKAFIAAHGPAKVGRKKKNAIQEIAEPEEKKEPVQIA